MNQEYNLSTSTLIFYGLIALGMCVLAVYFVGTYKPIVSAAVLLIPLFLIAGAVLIVINLFRRKIVIDQERIRYTSIFSTKELPVNVIKGARVGDKAIELEPLSPGFPRLLIGNYIDFGNYRELADWARKNFKDLDATDLEEDREKALRDLDLGSTEQDRQAYLDRQKTLTAVYNVFGAVFGFCLFFSAAPPFLLIGLLFPIAGIVLMALSKGAIKLISNPKRSISAYIVIGFFAPCFTLLIKSAGVYTILQIDRLWLPGIGVAGLVFLLLYMTGTNRSMGLIRAQIIFMVIAALLYGFGAVRVINCGFDGSSPKIYDSQVLDHRVARGKSTTYYLTLGPWGPRREETETEVSGFVYHHAAIDDTVKVYLNQGLLHIPWFTVLNK